MLYCNAPPTVWLAGVIFWAGGLKLGKKATNQKWLVPSSKLLEVNQTICCRGAFGQVSVEINHVSRQKQKDVILDLP